MLFAFPVMQGAATLVEARRDYDLGQWLDLVEVLQVKVENEHRARDAVQAQARRR